jgi:hypothetical protein
MCCQRLASPPPTHELQVKEHRRYGEPCGRPDENAARQKKRLRHQVLEAGLRRAGGRLFERPPYFSVTAPGRRDAFGRNEFMTA